MGALKIYGTSRDPLKGGGSGGPPTPTPTAHREGTYLRAPHSVTPDTAGHGRPRRRWQECREGPPSTT
jgi:hypothetical protein